MRLHPRARTASALALWLATMGCCAAGLAVALVVADHGSTSWPATSARSP